MPTAVPRLHRLHRLLPHLELLVPRSLPVPFRSHSSALSPLPLRSHFSALSRLPFLPLPATAAQKNRSKLSLASPPPLGAGWREIAPPSPPPKSHYPPLAAPLGTQPTTTEAAGRTQAARLTTPAAPTRSRRRLPPNHTPVHPSPPAPRRLPELRQNAPRRTSRVFWKKLLRAQDHPKIAPATPHQPQPHLSASAAKT